MGEMWKTFLKGVNFPSKRRREGITCIRPFLMLALTPRPKIKRADVPAV